MHEHDLILLSNRFNLNDSELEAELRLLKTVPEFEIGKTSKTIYQLNRTHVETQKIIVQTIGF